MTDKSQIEKSTSKAIYAGMLAYTKEGLRLGRGELRMDPRCFEIAVKAYAK